MKFILCAILLISFAEALQYYGRRELDGSGTTPKRRELIGQNSVYNTTPKRRLSHYNEQVPNSVYPVRRELAPVRRELRFNNAELYFQDATRRELQEEEATEEAPAAVEPATEVEEAAAVEPATEVEEPAAVEPATEVEEPAAAVEEPAAAAEEPTATEARRELGHPYYPPDAVYPAPRRELAAATDDYNPDDYNPDDCPPNTDPRRGLNGNDCGSAASAASAEPTARRELSPPMNIHPRRKL